jgi:hypothetical protein
MMTREGAAVQGQIAAAASNCTCATVKAVASDTKIYMSLRNFLVIQSEPLSVQTTSIKVVNL